MAPSMLMIAGTLFLAPAYPLQINTTLNSVWFSDAKKVEAQALGGKRLVLKAKSEGVLFASGLLNSTDTQRLQVLSNENYEALRRCPRAALDLQAAPFIFNGSEGPELNEIYRCGFRRLRLGEAAREKLEQTLIEKESRLRERGLRARRARWNEGRRELTLSSTDTEELRRVTRELGPLQVFFDIQLSEGPRPGRTLVFLLTLFEFSRRKAQALGLRWPEAVAVKSLDGQHWSWSKDDSPLVIGADFGESLGVGRVLAQPQIRTKPGEKASFQSGGEIPIRSSSLHGSNTTWKNYGLILNLEPDGNIETAAPEISLAFKVEVSEPDPSTALDGVPGMTVRRLESRFDLRVDENTVLTTMIQSRSGAIKNGLRGLLSLPLLGTLFSDRSDSEENSELCFSIKPSWEEILPRPTEKEWL